VVLNYNASGEPVGGEPPYPEKVSSSFFLRPPLCVLAGQLTQGFPRGRLLHRLEYLRTSWNFKIHNDLAANL